MFVQAVLQQNKGGHIITIRLCLNWEMETVSVGQTQQPASFPASVCFPPVTWILLVFGKQQNWNLEQLKKHLRSEVTVAFMSVNLNY